jgi:hypothetical protein
MGTEEIVAWEESPGIARSVITKPDDMHGLVNLDGHLYKRTLMGVLPNQDILV